MQAPTQNKSSQTKIFHLREFPLHIPIFIPLHLLIFWWFCFILISVLFFFFYKEQLAKSRGVFREGCKDFFKPIPGSSLAQGTQPQFIYSSFPMGLDFSFTPHLH